MIKWKMNHIRSTVLMWSRTSPTIRGRFSTMTKHAPRLLRRLSTAVPAVSLFLQQSGACSSFCFCSRRSSNFEAQRRRTGGRLEAGRQVVSVDRSLLWLLFQVGQLVGRLIADKVIYNMNQFRSYVLKHSLCELFCIPV